MCETVSPNSAHALINTLKIKLCLFIAQNESNIDKNNETPQDHEQQQQQQQENDDVATSQQQQQQHPDQQQENDEITEQVSLDNKNEVCM